MMFIAQADFRGPTGAVSHCLMEMTFLSRNRTLIVLTL